jgi:4-oxalocrotonate tautomerase
MPIVTIELLEGRTVEQKRELAKKITEAFQEVIKVTPETVSIIYHDMKKENYAPAGVLLIDK